METTIYEMVKRTTHPVHAYHVAWSWACRRVFLLSNGEIKLEVMEQEFILMRQAVRKHVEHLQYEEIHQRAGEVGEAYPHRHTAKGGSGGVTPSPRPTT